ncbi:serine hydrolase domain-containing protein [Streptomyces sp. NPDC007901]|uniref:serine hydrolase domain-containing protein n=1 Tax=Streptomyces sp. NPDC007901 TaxID=3364785 RepID=UPI0036E4AB80
MSHSSAMPRRGAATVLALGILSAPLAGGTAGAPPATVPAAFAAPSPTPAPSGSADVRGMTPAVARQLDAAVQHVMREADVPGVTVGVWTPGQADYVRSFGTANKATGQPMSSDLYMRIGSETKMFTVTAVLQLVDQGRVSLDDPIGKYVDGVPNGDRITLRDLAGMRSGLFNYSEDDGFFKALTTDPRRHFTPQELLGYSFRHPVMFQPGQRFYYSNTNLILLGLLVEKESGQRLGDYIGQHILGPAGMRHTLFPTGNEFPTPHAQGYTDQTATGKVEETAGWDPSWAWAAGAMISDLDDLHSWARTAATGVFPDGRTMVSPAVQRQRLTTPPTGIAGAGYGLGIFDVQGWIGHNGSLPGYEALTVYLPSTRTTVVVLLNTDISYRGTIEPSTLFGQAITRIISPAHAFDLPAPASATR